MRKALVPAVCLALASAASGGAVRTVTAPATVGALAADGALIAYATGRSATDCNRVFVWNLTTRAVTKLGRKTHCVQTSTGNAISGLAIAGTRVLWLHYVGGNTREWSLWTATTMQPTPKPLRFQTTDVDDPAPLVLGVGSDSPAGFVLPYAFGDRVFNLRADGGRSYSWKAPGRVVALASHAGRLAVASAGGVVTTLDASGRPLGAERFSGEVLALRLTARALVVQRGGLLELRAEGTSRTWPIGAGARLEDANETAAFFVARGEAWRLAFADGARRPLARATHVQVEGVRAAGSSGRTVKVQRLP